MGRRRANCQNCTIAKHMNEQNKKTCIIKIKELVIVKKLNKIKELGKIKSLQKARDYRACKNCKNLNVKITCSL